MAKIVDNLLSQEMDRREFLVRVGATALALVGIEGILKTMSGSHSDKRVTGPAYGGGAYGGKGDGTTAAVSTVRAPRQFG